MIPLVAIPVVILGISSFIYGAAEDQMEKVKAAWAKGYSIWKKPLIIYFSIYFVVSTLSFLAPDRETSYTMLAAYGVQSAMESVQLQGVASKSLQLLEARIGEYLEESAPAEVVAESK
jgi:hypothetical protein